MDELFTPEEMYEMMQKKKEDDKPFSFITPKEDTEFKTLIGDSSFKDALERLEQDKKEEQGYLGKEIGDVKSQLRDIYGTQKANPEASRIYDQRLIDLSNKLMQLKGVRGSIDEAEAEKLRSDKANRTKTDISDIMPKNSSSMPSRDDIMRDVMSKSKFGSQPSPSKQNISDILPATSSSKMSDEDLINMLSGSESPKSEERYGKSDLSDIMPSNATAMPSRDDVMRDIMRKISQPSRASSARTDISDLMPSQASAMPSREDIFKDILAEKSGYSSGRSSRMDISDLMPRASSELTARDAFPTPSPTPRSTPVDISDLIPSASSSKYSAPMATPSPSPMEERAETYAPITRKKPKGLMTEAELSYLQDPAQFEKEQDEQFIKEAIAELKKPKGIFGLGGKAPKERESYYQRAALEALKAKKELDEVNREAEAAEESPALARLQYPFTKALKPIENLRETLMEGREEQDIEEVNKMREEMGLPPLPVESKPEALKSDDGRPYQFTRQPFTSTPPLSSGLDLSDQEMYPQYKKSEMPMGEMEEEAPEKPVAKKATKKAAVAKEELPEGPSATEALTFDDINKAGTSALDVGAEPVKRLAPSEKGIEQKGEMPKAKAIKGKEEPASSEEKDAQAYIDANREQGLSFIKKLEQAEDESERNLMLANLGKALSQVTAGVGAIKSKTPVAVPSTDVFDALIKDAKAPVEKLKRRIEMEKDDPDSEASRALREIAQKDLGKAGLQVNLGKMSYNQIEKIFPQLARTAERLELARIKKEDRAASAADRQQQRSDMINLRTMAGLGLKLESVGGPAGTTLRNRILQSGNIYATLKLDPEEMARMSEKQIESRLDEAKKLNAVEAAIELNKLLSGAGVGSDARLEKLLLDSGYQKGMSAMEYLANRQFKRNQGKYLKGIIDITAQAEKRGLEDLKQMKVRALSGNLSLLKNPMTRPDFINLINSHGIELEDLMAKSPKEVAKKKEEARMYEPRIEAGIASYMRANNLQRNEAIQRLKQLGKIK